MKLGRHTQIIELVNEKKKMSVNDLADLLNVSPVTIRRDLTYLEKSGLLIRHHGFALSRNTADINNRLGTRYDKKLKIAQKALEMISDNETIMIESGSGCALFAEAVVQNRMNVVIITNSAFIASYIRNKGNARIILLGGEYQQSSEVMTGSMVRKAASDFHVDKLFIGTDGISKKSGLTGSDMPRAEAVQAMHDVANRTIVLADSSKFDNDSTVCILDLKKIDEIITDESAENLDTSYLEDYNITLTIAK